MDIFSHHIEDLTERRYITKQEARPLMGWPGGIDPYPNKCDDEIICIVVHQKHLRLKASATLAFHGEVARGSIVEFHNFKFEVNDLSLDIDENRQAVHFTADYWGEINGVSPNSQSSTIN